MPHVFENAEKAFIRMRFENSDGLQRQIIFRITNERLDMYTDSLAPSLTKFLMIFNIDVVVMRQRRCDFDAKSLVRKP